MPRKETTEYILGSEAAAIISHNSGHKVTANYVRVLAGSKHGKIRSRWRDGRTREYHRGDVEEYRVKHIPQKERPEEQISDEAA